MDEGPVAAQQEKLPMDAEEPVAENKEADSSASSDKQESPMDELKEDAQEAVGTLSLKEEEAEAEVLRLEKETTLKKAEEEAAVLLKEQEESAEAIRLKEEEEEAAEALRHKNKKKHLKLCV